MKKLASVFLTFLFCIGLSFALVACQNDAPPATSGYQFTIVNGSGEAVSNVNVQLCDPATGTCLTDTFTTDANGKVLCAVPEKVYDVHVFAVDFVTEYEVVGTNQTPATYSEILITIIQ